MGVMNDLELYWDDRGRKRFSKRMDKAYQEARLMGLLENKRIEAAVDFGCGYGRIGRILFEVHPELKIYVGVDLSLSQISQARLNIDRREALFVHSTIRDFEVADGAFDLSIAVEVLMHIGPGDILQSMKKMVDASKRYIINIDWARKSPVLPDVNGYSFNYDYGCLYQRLGYHAESVDLPRLSGEPQKMWIVTK